MPRIGLSRLLVVEENLAGGALSGLARTVGCLIALGILAGCRFEADYSGGSYTCYDGNCPDDLECREDMSPPVCQERRRDAAILDMPGDVMTDGDGAMMPALTCVQPGSMTSGVAVNGNTMTQSFLMSSFCNGGVQNGRDAVYKITTQQSNKQLVVAITGTLNAYVLNACSQSPNTAACLGGTAAIAGNPISVSAANAGDYWVVVDNLNAGVAGAYSLTVTIQ